MRRIWLWFGVIVLILVILLVWQRPDERVHVVFCDVGQGDATLIVKGSFQMLIDGGPSEVKLLSCLEKNVPFWDREIEVVINTHPEKDHLGGLGAVLSSFRVGQIVINGVYKEGREAADLRQRIIESGVKVVVPKRGDTVRYPDLQFEILWPEERQGESLTWTSESSEVVLGEKTGVNEMSVVVKLIYGEFRVLLTGDISSEEEEKIGEDGFWDDISVLKVAHHGSKYSSGIEFLEKVRPEEAIIMVGKNSYGHPTEEVLERLKMVGARIWRTDQDGQIEVVSDGRGYFVVEN